MFIYLNEHKIKQQLKREYLTEIKIISVFFDNTKMHYMIYYNKKKFLCLYALLVIALETCNGFTNADLLRPTA